MATLTTEQQQAIARSRARARAAQAKAEAEKSGALGALGKGFMRGVSDVSDTIVKVAADLVDRAGFTPAAAVAWAAENVSGYSKADAAKIARNLKSLPNFKTVVNAGQQANKMRDVPSEQAHPYMYGGGRIGGQVFGTAPIPGLMAKPVRALAGGTKAGQVAATALESSGFKTGMLPTREAIKKGLAEAPALVDRVVDMAVRGAAGFATGANVAVASDQNAGMGALIGMLMPTAGSAAFRTVADKVLLPAWERLSGQLGVQRAAAVFRSAFNMGVQDVMNLARSAQGDTPFAKVVAQSGAYEPTAQALGKMAAEGVGKPVYGPIARAEKQAQQDIINSMARGGTEREARNAMMQTKSALGEQYAGEQAKAFERANLGNQVVPGLEQRSAQATQQAAEQSALARRMAFGSNRAENAVGFRDMVGEELGVPNFEAVNIAKGRAGAMGQRAETAAQEAIRLRGEAAAAQQQIIDLAAQGVHALETKPIASQIRAMANAEGAGEVQRKALLDIADQIESHGPIIRAGDLDAVRRGANVAIARLNQGLDVGSVNKAAARVVGQIKPIIDHAIGADYKAAKEAFATGASDLERQAFAGDLAHMFETDPSKFAATVGGARGTTGTVEAAFPRAGNKNFDIQEMMGVPGGAAGPSRMPALENIAADVRVNQNMASQASEAETAAKNLLKAPPQEADVFHKFSPVGIATNASAALLRFAKVLSDTGLDAKIQKTLAEGFRNGESAEKLLMTVPLADRAQVARRMADNGLLSAKSAAGIASFNALNTPPGQVLVGEGVGPSGEIYPMYGPRDKNRNVNSMRR